MENGENFLPTQSILLMPEKEIRTNYFQSQILIDIKPQDEKKHIEQDKLIKDLEDILICCICYNYLENPVNDPSCCVHYECKKCFDQYFKKQKASLYSLPFMQEKNL